ncbi:hypothetical protein AMECASPLE_008424 [Ameca splendens]|uniref:Secreted protein n=1 Tax=Ameca splendens TaxID=208324 RepID=A0ABV0ZJN5_9TELE
MLPALRRLSVLPLWYFFFQSGFTGSHWTPYSQLSQQKLSTLQRVAPLDSVCKETPNQSSDPWEGSVNQSNRANQAYQTRNHIPPANQLHLQTVRYLILQIRIVPILYLPVSLPCSREVPVPEHFKLHNLSECFLHVGQIGYKQNDRILGQGTVKSH